MMTRNHPIEPEELMAYLDGELPLDRAAETAGHLERCPECQTLAAGLREVSRKLMAWQVETPEVAKTESIEAAFAAGTKKPVKNTHRLIWRVVFTGGLAAATLLLVVAFFTPNLMRSRKAAEESAQLHRDWRWVQEQPYVSQTLSKLPEKPAPGPSASGGSAKPAEKSARRTDARDAEMVRAQNQPAAGDRLREDKGAPQPPASDNSVSATASQVNDTGLVQQSVLKDDNLTAHNTKSSGASAGPAAKADALKPETIKTAPGPMIVHTAQISLTISDFDRGRAAIEEILKRHGGYVGSLNVSAPPGSGRTLNATLRVPAAQLQETLAELKKLGRVTAESQSGEEVTQQYVDLEARLANARNSEQRLKELLRDRTGKLKDVMEVELQIGQVREEIETMEAERKNLGNRVDYATLTVTLAEEYKAELQVVPVSTWTRISNAAVEGYHTMAEGLIDVALFLASVGPSLLLWALILFLPVRRIWKRYKPRAMAA